MSLSNDLVTKFVKLTNDTSKPKESTVYGTVVDQGGVKYVKIDGSDLLTPVATTADIQAGERVTVMIKNHSATVMGNISTPSASSKVVGQVVQSVGDMGDKITEIEILVADRVSTGELDAEVARIDQLIAGCATIEQLDAANATIKVLDTEVADIQTLVNGNLTSDNIASLNLTSANTTIENAMIKDAMIDNISAGKIVSGTINTSLITVQSDDGSMILTGSLQQFKDDNGIVRIQLGKDSSGNFSFILYDETGKGVLLNETGIQSSDAIADGLIVDAKVADDAAISGSKLDIESVVVEVNNSTTTIKSNKIYLDNEQQTLDVLFNAMKTATEENTDRIKSNTTSLEIQNGQISTLISENEIIQTELSELSNETSEISTKYSLLEQDVDEFKVSVGETYATKETVYDINTNLTTDYSTTEAMTAAINMKADEITSSVSATYATKDEMNSTVNQKADEITASVSATYATKDEMNSAISVKADEITSSVSATYATKEYVDDVKVDLKENYSTTTQMNSAISQKADEISTSVSETYATIGTVNDLNNNLTTNYSTTTAMNSAINQKADEIINTVDASYPTNDDMNSAIIQKADEITASVSATYATKDEMNSAISVKADEITSSVSVTYATKEYVDGIVIEGAEGITEEQMNSAINQKADEITSSVSATYATKDEMSSQISQTTTSLTATFTELHESGYSQGITEIDKDGVKVTQSDYQGYTQMKADGFYLHDGVENVISCTSSGLSIKGKVEVTSGSISGSTTIDGGGITTGTINASSIKSNSITASQIAAGIITADEIAARTITASEIKSGTITANEIAAGTITASEIKSGTITSDLLAAGAIKVGNILQADTQSKAYIQLFDDCSLDASFGALRLQYDASNYIYIDGGQFQYYSTSGGSASPTWAFYGGTATQTMYTNSNTFTVNSNGMTISNGGYHSNGTSYLDYIRCDGSATISYVYATSVEASSYVYCNYLDDYSGSGITMKTALNGNSQNLGYSGSKFYQLSASYVWGDNGSVSDEKFKENIRYINKNRKGDKSVLYNDRNPIKKQNTKTRDYNNENIIVDDDFYKFVRDELDICEYNYIREDGEKFEENFVDKIGFIANDYADSKVGSKIVGYTSEGFYAMNTNNLLFVTLGALQYEINKRDSEIEELQDRLSALEKGKK